MNINKELQCYSLEGLLKTRHAGWAAATIYSNTGDGRASSRHGRGAALYFLVVVVTQDFCVQEMIGERQGTLP